MARLRKGRSPLRAVEETIAALHEELEFSLNFAHAMVREENYHAAADVIEEQRKSLTKAADRIDHALRGPEIERRRVRSRAALVGLAAALTLASGAFAAFRAPTAQSPVRTQSIEAIQEASNALEMAVQISDPVALEAIVAGAQAQILEAAIDSSGDPMVTEQLLDSVQKLRTVIQANPNLPKPVREAAQAVAKQVTDIVVSVPEATKDTTESTTETAPSAPAEAAEPAEAPSV